MQGACTGRAWKGPALAGLGLALLLATGSRAALPVPEGAWAEGAFEGDEARVEARLLVDAGPAGSPVRVGVLFDLDPGWHLYWRNPGESGLATELRWQVEGAEVGPVAWPAPARFEESDGLLTTYGYEDQVLLASELAGDADGLASVEVDALVCRYACLPASFSLWRRVPEGDADPAVAQLFARYAARVPVAPEALGLELSAVSAPARPGGAPAARLELRGPGAARTASALPVFFPDLEAADLRVAAHGPHPEEPDATVVELAARDGAPTAAGARLAGVLTLDAPGAAPRHLAVDLPLLPSAAAAAPAPAAATPVAPLALASAIGLALLGGLLLNLMPCVLPVLAIKVFALTELAHRSRREVWAHALAYTAGILATMLALASVVLGLRAAGTAVGWGFQFQEPLFAAVVSGVLVVFALNLFGVFEIAVSTGGLAGIGAQASGPRRSFFEGLLAVVLATPCSAPFLGTAVGFAFASPAPATLAIFAAIGLGLAAPYALVSAVPAWARWIPRSGRWMLKLRAGLGFALLATTVWLVWIVGRSTGIDGATQLLALLVGVAFAAWLYGQLQAAQRRGLAWAALAFAGLAVAGLNAIHLEPASGRSGRHAAERWAPFDASRVADEIARGRPVFVTFTADWCITCQVNERTVLDHERVRAEFDRLDVALFQADWTLRDEAIRTELARFGKAGVPLYLVYPPGAPESPLLLPELLSVDRVLDALRQAAGDAGPARPRAV